MSESLGAIVAMSLLILLSSVTFLVLLNVWDFQSTESMNNAALLTDRINTRVSIDSTAADGDCEEYTVVISNQGRTYISDFSEMDVIADYQDSGGIRVYRRLGYVTGKQLGQNEWALDSIAPDTRDPNTWNPGETLTINLKVNPEVSSTVSGSLVVATPFGVTDSAYFGC